MKSGPTTGGRSLLAGENIISFWKSLSICLRCSARLQALGERVPFMELQAAHSSCKLPRSLLALRGNISLALAINQP